MEVINLSKDNKPKKKLREKKVYSSVVDTDSAALVKKPIKRRVEKTNSGLLNYSNEAVGLANKTPLAYQIKPKKFKKRLTMGGLNSAKGKYIPLTNETQMNQTSQTRKTSRKPGIPLKGHLKSQSIYSDLKPHESPRYMLKSQQGLDVPVHMLRSMVDNKTMDNRGYK